MYKLRNETKNERVRNSLDELTCHLNNPDVKIHPAARPTTTKITTPEPKTIHQPFSEYEEEENPIDEDDEYLYDQQENNSNSLPSTQKEDPSVKHLFQIAVEDLPCPRSLVAATETTHRIEGTPPPDFPFMLSSNRRANSGNLVNPSFVSVSVSLLFIFILFT